MWSELLHSRMIIPLVLLAVFSSLAITPLVFIYAQREERTARDNSSVELYKSILVTRLLTSDMDSRLTKLEVANRSMQQQIDSLTAQLSQVIALTSGKEKKQ